MSPIEKATIALYEIILHREVSPSELVSRVHSAPENAEVLGYALQLAEELLNSDEYCGKPELNSSSFNVTDLDVYYAYKFLLGRLPEAEHVYAEKSAIDTIENLLKSIINSDEFKTNKILKDAVSIKRKPFGVESVSFAAETKAKTIIVLSGCQGKTIADLFQVKTGLPAVPHLFMGGKVLFDFVNTQGSDYLDTLRQFDLIYTQKHDVFEVLSGIEGFSERVRLMPLVEYPAFHPDQVYIIDEMTNERIVGPLGEYHSLIVSAAFYSGFSEERCVNLFNPLTYQAFGFYNAYSSSRSDLLAQEPRTGYPLSELLPKWDEQGQWMRTINHPKKFVLSDLVQHALEKESIGAMEGVDEYVIDDLASNAHWPLYPGLYPDQAVSAHLRFKLPNALAPLANAGIFLNLDEFVAATYRSLTPHDLGSVTAKQLDRQIDLHAMIFKLSEF